MKRNGTKRNGKDRRSMYSSVRSMMRLQGRLVIKPGTERNEMERNETKWKRASKVWTLRLQGQMRLGGLQADKPDTECTLARLNPMLRMSVWTPSNTEGVWRWTPSNAEA